MRLLLEHLADLGHFRLAAEVPDLLLEDRRDFGGADVHQDTSFIACFIILSLVRSELSTMRDPSFTTSPPIMAGLIFTSTCTSLPVTELSASLMAARWYSLAGEYHLAAIKDALSSVTGKDVQVDVKINPAIIGGLVVKLGSRMVDSSLRTKLNMMKHAMKEVS